MAKAILSSAGYLSSTILTDGIITLLVLLILNKLILPLIRSYKHSKFLDETLGTDSEKHWLLGHLRKVSHKFIKTCIIF